MIDEYNIKKQFFLYIADFLQKYPYRKIDARVMELQHQLTIDLNNPIDPMWNKSYSTTGNKQTVESEEQERSDNVIDLLEHAVNN